MATTLDTRIQLVGGQQLQAQLLSIGKTGERVFAALEGAASMTAQPMTRLSTAAAAVQSQLAGLRNAASEVGSRVAGLVTPLASLAQNLGLVGGVGLAGAAAGLVALARNSAATADATGKAAAAVGLSTEQFGKFAFAARQGGVDADAFTQALVTFANAAQSGDERFARLGVSVTDSSGNFRDLDDLFRDVADRLSAMPDGFQKTALATDLFGRAGARLIPVLAGGSAGLARLGDEAVRTGALVTAEQASIAEKFGDSTDRLLATVQGAIRAAVTPLLPTLTQITDEVTKWVVANKGALIDLADNGFNKLKSVVNDVFKLFRGDTTEIQNKWLLDLYKGARDVAAAFEDFWGWLSRVAGVIGLSGGELGLIVAIGTLTGGFSAFAAVLTTVISTAKLLMTLLVGPLSIIAAIVGWPVTLAAVGVAIYAFWDDIVAGANRVWDSFKRIFPGLAQTIEFAVRDGVNAAIAWLGNLWAQAEATYNAVRNRIRGALGLSTDSGSGWTGWIVQPSGGSSDPMGYASGGSVRRRRTWTGWRVKRSRGWKAHRFSDFAEGGRVYGPGTETSDSIPARLSAGEFVMRAAAVRHYGEGVMHSMNSMTAPRGFAEGGAVSAAPGDVNLTFTGPIMAPDPEAFISNLNRYLDNGGRARIRSMALGERGKMTV